MRTLREIGLLTSLVLLPAVAPAAPLDGSAPMFCALTVVVECARLGECARTSAEEAGIPPFILVSIAERKLATPDGVRTSPIASVQRANGRLMIQGLQGERVWGAVIDERTGRMSATAGEAAGAFVISGSCIAP